MQSKVHPTYKTKYRVANGPAYNQALVRRGDVTVWLTSERTPKHVIVELLRLTLTRVAELGVRTLSGSDESWYD